MGSNCGALNSVGYEMYIYIDSMHDESWTNTILTNILFKENEGMAKSNTLCSFATEQTSNP